MYVANHNGSSITVLRDTLVVGVEEVTESEGEMTKAAAVVRGVLFLGASSNQQSAFRAELLDISGRKVISLTPGANDVRSLAPGVYFVTVSGERCTVYARKVVVTR